MAWERRANGRAYYYKGERRDGQVLKLCLGRGAEAEQQAARIESARRQRRSDLQTIEALGKPERWPMELFAEFDNAAEFSL